MPRRNLASKGDGYVADKRKYTAYSCPSDWFSMATHVQNLTTSLFSNWKYLAFVLLLLSVFLADAGKAHNTGQGAEGYIVGEWYAERLTTEFGRAQITFRFDADGSFSVKEDMISICHYLDCQFAWEIYEGKYSMTDGMITSNNNKYTRVLKWKDKPPETRGGSRKGFERRLRVIEVDAGSLVLKEGNRLYELKRNSTNSD